MLIPKSIRDKSCYYACHEDFGHTKNDCKSLHGKIIFTIKKGGLTQYVKIATTTPKEANPFSSRASKKGKRVKPEEISNE